MKNAMVGDKVTLKAMRVIQALNGGRIVELKDEESGLRVMCQGVHIESIERPETDWSKVPWLAPCRVRDDECDEWEPAHYLRHTPSNDYPHSAIGVGRACSTFWRYCELVEEQP